MKEVEHLIVSEKCSGCEACINSCPQNVLLRGYDNEGFVIPVIQNVSDCIDCAKCIKVCQTHNKEEQISSEPICSYVAQSKDVRNAKRSSSGGAFWTIGRYWIEQLHGVVVGAAYCEDHYVRHIEVDNLKDLRRLQGSKYVQSLVGDIYIRVKKRLQNGDYVLFSGTPCQVKGLQLYLQRDYEKLLTIDIICHGVTSPKLLNDYIEKIEENEGRKCINIKFRWKNPWFKSGSPYYMIMMMNNGLKLIRAGKNDPYLNIYLSGYAFRESCYNCQFACTKRVGDITLGDNDSHECYPDFHAEESNSTLLLNTKRACHIWENCLRSLFDYIPLDFNMEVKYNKQLKAPFQRPIQRNNVYNRWSELSYKQILQEFGSPQSFLQYLRLRISLLMPLYIKHFLHS